MKSYELRVGHYVQQALGSHDTAEAASIWLAVFIANEVASSATDRARSTLVEAYRRVRALADAEMDAS